ncbi:CPBP family intramembrane glutamic endopeptidase [Peribacillus sp. NPDC097675]|uniref:CPBP family intramembrane glutamic endopeptidase n=1 Tax=Peribacillus sp. NPDC097675 TaxID=3390618 RepID=UPI003CFD5935
MKNELTFKRPYLILIGLEIITLLFVSIGAAITEITKISNPIAPFMGFIPLALLLILYFTIKKQWRTFYFHSLRDLRIQEWVLYAPLLFFLILLVVFNNGISVPSSSYLLFLSMGIIMNAFVEESVFRGLMIKILLPKGEIKAIIVSSLFFGFGHLAQAFQNPSFSVFIQVFYALLVGLVLALLVVQTRSIIIPIIFHFLHNFLQYTGQNVSDVATIRMNDLILIAILIMYIIALLIFRKKNIGSHSSVTLDR